MPLKQRDWIFVGLVVVVLGIFIAISGEETTTKVPYDDTHQPFYEMRQAGEKKITVDALCADCHDGEQIAFPPDHPVKPGDGHMRCLFCHKLEPGRQ